MNETTKLIRYYAFIWDDYDAGGGMNDCVGSFDSLDAILDANPAQRDSLDPNLHVAYVQNEELITLHYISDAIKENAQYRIVIWGWKHPDGHIDWIRSVGQRFEVYKPNGSFLSLGVTGYFPSGHWISDPL